MKIASISILGIVFILTICLIIFLISIFKKHRKKVISDFVKDLNNTYHNFQLNKITHKQLPVAAAALDEDIYFYNKVVIGQYDNATGIISQSNFNVSNFLASKKFETFYRYKIINLTSSKFVALNKIDVLLTNNKIHLYHPLVPEILLVDQVKNLTIFWEKNALIKSKTFFPGVGFNYQKHSYFLLFQTYDEVLKFVTCLNLIQID